LAESILEGYAERYASYPNVDNVLGPTRLFFSTYLESIWLLQICVATDLIDAHNPALADRVRDQIIEPSRAIIVEYDEGGSNRQVWNDAALLAAARSLGDTRAANKAVFGPSGVSSHLATGLLPDGTWYEGENYHLFAHRGLWYGVVMATHAGMEIPQTLLDRFQLGFSTPFMTALPDFTLPSRRDSQYAISLRQWRIAEHCELGLARAEDPTLIGALQRMYCDDVQRADTGRRNSSADVERNGPPSSLTRADLGWRALLFARAELPPLEPQSPRSALLDAQGIAVFRRNEGRTYVALDYGNSGGGHGHPDRLNLLLADGEQRWLDDYGTGSYVDASLHWYRSTLAHNAPLVDGASQLKVDGTLMAYDERGAAGWIHATARIASSTRAERSIVVMADYVIDDVVWVADHDVTVDLPIHADVVLQSGADELKPKTLSGGRGTEDGFRFVRDTEMQRALGGATTHGSASSDGGPALRAWTRSEQDIEWWRGVAPGPPGRSDRVFRLLRARGATGRYRTVMAHSDNVVAAEIDDEIRILLADGTRHVHRRSDDGWHIVLHAGGAKSGIDLAGFVVKHSAAETADTRDRAARFPLVALSSNAAHPTVLHLGEAHYRRSEQSWVDAARPTAEVAFSWSGRALLIAIDVPRSDLTFAAAIAVNPYDNEPPDINGDGVQLYLSSNRGLSGWMLVPEIESNRVRIRQLEGWAEPTSITATWSRAKDGYRLNVEITDCVPTAIDAIINEMPRGRERRRGQLLMSGAAGEFVYLRGDRHDVSRLLPLRITDG
jgi:Heparinase II/III-like protein